MSAFREVPSLTHQRRAEGACRRRCHEPRKWRVPQNIVIVDTSGVNLASIRMDGAKYLSMRYGDRQGALRGIASMRRQATSPSRQA